MTLVVVLSICILITPHCWHHFRSDSPAYQAEVINYYNQPGRRFTITADLDQAVKREIEHLPETAWQPYRTADGGTTDREIAETVLTMKGTKQAFRLIVLRWANPQPSLLEAEQYCYHAVATNREEAPSQVVWKHNQRGEGVVSSASPKPADGSKRTIAN